MKIELYRDKANEFRWRLQHTNGKVLADCGEGYKTKRKMLQGLAAVEAAFAHSGGVITEDNTNPKKPGRGIKGMSELLP